MSELRRRQTAATKEMEQRTRANDASESARRARDERERSGKIAAAHANARTKQSQVSSRTIRPGR